jgi:hypothetical protein
MHQLSLCNPNLLDLEIPFCTRSMNDGFSAGAGEYISLQRDIGEGGVERGCWVKLEFGTECD